MNNINLKSYELEFEADPLFHKVYLNIAASMRTEPILICSVCSLDVPIV